MGTKYSTNSASGYNATPPADDGTVSEANKIKWSTAKTKLADPIKDLADTINTDLVEHFNNGPVAITSNTTLVASHNNKTIQVSGSGVTLTLTDAATLTAGWFCDIVSTDSSNSVSLARATASDMINETSADVTILPLQSLRLIVNAAANGFLVSLAPRHSKAFKLSNDITLSGDLTMSGTSIIEAEGAAVASAGTTNIWATDGNTVHITGTTTITSFGTAPQAGAWMKVIFDGALTLTHGANLNLPGSANITTAANDFAFVYADTTTLFRVAYFKADGTPVALPVATQAQQETGTSLLVAVTPGRQQYHASAAKVWAVFDTVTSTSLLASYNVSSLTDDGTGVTTVNFTTAFSSVNYAVTRNTGEVAIGDIIASSRAVGSVQIRTRNVAETLTDTLGVSCSCFGDQ